MAQNFLTCDREQVLLLPPDLRDWLPAGHLAWFVLDVVDEIDLEAFLADYRVDGWGRAAFDWLSQSHEGPHPLSGLAVTGLI